MRPDVTGFFHKQTSAVAYVVAEPDGEHCAVIDPVLDFDYKSARTDTDCSDEIVEFVRDRGLRVDWILETHVHADHLTGALTIKERLGGSIGIGRHVDAVQRTFAPIFNLGNTFRTDGSQFDHLFADGETFRIGAMTARVMHTPGHTPACVTYVIGDAAFVGDTLFMPDGGTARADFPGGDAHELYRSIRRILDLEPETRLFVCHDYAPGGREYRWETTVAAQRAENIHVRDGVSEAEFVQLRESRDSGLETPTLLIPAIQVNMRAGRFPEAESNGVVYLKVPLNTL